MTLQGMVNAAQPNTELDLTGDVFTGEKVGIDKALILLNGTITGPVAANKFDDGVVKFLVNDITIDGMNADGGARVFYGVGSQVELGNSHRDRITIRNTLINRNLHKGAPLQWYGGIQD